MAKPFPDHRLAARQLLTLTNLTEREGQFLGGISYRLGPLTEKQERWLLILLDRHGFPSLADGGAE